MGWSPAYLFNCLEAAPAATLALYSGRGNEGVLRVVARAGHMVALISSWHPRAAAT
jgi:hypothetical protein